MSAASPAAPDVWTPQDISGIEFWAPTDTVYHSAAESQATRATSVTRVSAADAQSIGYAATPVYGHLASAVTAGTSPTTSTELSANGAWKFTGASSQRFIILGTAPTFAFLHQDVAATIAFKLKPNNDAATWAIMDAAEGTTTNKGLIINRSSANKLQVAVSKGGGLALYNYTTTAATWTSAGGWKAVVIKLNGASSSIAWASLDATGNAITSAWTTETFTYTSAGAGTGDMTNDLRIGSRASGAAASTMSFAQPIIMRGVLSDADRDLWIAYGSALSSTSLTAARPDSPSGFNFTWAMYRFDRVDALFQDAAFTTPVVAAGDPVGCVLPEGQTDDRLGRKLSTAVAGEFPLFQTNAVDFDGVDDDIAMASAFQGQLEFTLIAVVRNDDTTNGSHVLRMASSGYWAVTGDTYIGNPGGAAYHTIHFNGAASAQSSLVSETGYNTVEVRQNAGTTTARTNATNKTTDSAGSTNFPWIGMGDFNAGLTNWQFDGRIKRLYVIVADLGDANAATIVNAQDLSA